MAQVIAICNQKGGVGKTTTSINLSACFAGAEKRVLLIDLDPQSNATTGLGFNKYEAEKSIYNVLVEDFPIAEAVQATEMPYLSLLPASPALVGAEVELVTVMSRETRLKEQIDKVRDDYDYIIIDCAPSLGLLTLNSLCAADSVLVPVQCEYFAMEGMAELQKTIQLVQQRINQNLSILGIVLTMYDPRNNLSRQVQESMRKYFNEKVFEVLIPRNVRLSEAPSHGKPIVLYDVECKGATSYIELAQEVMKHTEAKDLPLHEEREEDEVVAEGVEAEFQASPFETELSIPAPEHNVLQGALDSCDRTS
ncbi:MAG: hypothetical protein COX62_00325 [Deltaproteobacteria bacterium CG_4_10_14_0_2_um_filter_43_8]|nr:MAG: hypothetical protein COV43_03585 [Deltaproteobacteria bacterium CG11_big_fil_rev_8_21_14_0_20_42_23]PJA22269.1 MAG: hypothetical protein COX62_00325 [Deltaproteobacteria bacterium CG_4_10_14_0_2_um_filter_43_8]PJC63510.1 MAG: hypothetical protein CO021_09245 [Deltaproteobacteria bacterium CG_4_9_14_0_2_um_filter_42_21]